MYFLIIQLFFNFNLIYFLTGVVGIAYLASACEPEVEFRTAIVEYLNNDIITGQVWAHFNAVVIFVIVVVVVVVAVVTIIVVIVIVVVVIGVVVVIVVAIAVFIVNDKSWLLLKS
jgi:hypothetical protein